MANSPRRNPFEQARRLVLDTLDRGEAIFVLLAGFTFLGVCLLTSAVWLPAPYKHALAIGGLAFIALNFGLAGLGALAARRQARLLLEDRELPDLLGQLVSSLIELSIHLQSLSLSLFRTVDRNSAAIVGNLRAFAFVPGVQSLADLGPEQAGALARSLVEVTEGWKMVFEDLRRRAALASLDDVASQKRVLAEAREALLVSCGVFGALEREVDALVDPTDPVDGRRRLTVILGLLEDLRRALKTRRRPAHLR